MKIFNFILISLLCFGLHAQNKVLRYTEGADKGNVKESDLKVNWSNIQGAPGLTLQNVLANGSTATYIPSLGNVSATAGSVLLKANYDNYNAQALITERSSGAIGLSCYMYQNNSPTWLSSFNYGAIARSALFVGNYGIKMLSAPSQNVAAESALTTQPSPVFSVDIAGNAIFSGDINAGGIISGKSFGVGTQNGLTNKMRLYDAGGILESESDNSFGFGISHSSGRFAISAGQNGYIDFFTQNTKRMRVEYSGDVSINNNLSVTSLYANSLVRTNGQFQAYSDATKGYATVVNGTIGGGGYLEIYRPNQQRSLYLGFSSNIGANNYVAENNSWHKFSGGKVEIANDLEAYKGTFINNISTLGQYEGGFGAVETGGFLDWNHISNKKSGNGYSLLLGTATGGNGQSGYYHAFNFEYASKNGTGNFTRLAIPYYGTDLWLQSWYDGIGYRPWKTYIQSSKVQDVENNDIVHSGNINNFIGNASNLTSGTLPDARLSANVPLKNATNTFTGFNSFEGGYTTRFETINIRNVNVSLVNSAGMFQNNTGVFELKANITNATKVFINTANELDVTGLTAQTAKTVSDKQRQDYTISLVANGSTTLNADANFVIFNARSGTFNSAGEIYTINLPAVPNAETQEIDFAFDGILAPQGLLLNLTYNSVTIPIRVDLTASFSEIYKITTAANSTFRLKYHAALNKWKLLQLNNF